jgi:single-stranded DNA-binding protein
VYYKENGIGRKTRWHRVTAWGKQQKSLKNMTKGKEVRRETTHHPATMIKTSERFITEVVANELLLLGKQ